METICSECPHFIFFFLQSVLKSIESLAKTFTELKVSVFFFHIFLLSAVNSLSCRIAVPLQSSRMTVYHEDFCSTWLYFVRSNMVIITFDSRLSLYIMDVSLKIALANIKITNNVFVSIFHFEIRLLLFQDYFKISLRILKNAKSTSKSVKVTIGRRGVNICVLDWFDCL